MGDRKVYGGRQKKRKHVIKFGGGVRDSSAGVKSERIQRIRFRSLS